MRVARDATPVPAGRLETPDSSDLRESGVKSAPRGAWHRHRLHAVGEVDPDGCAELGTDRVTCGAWRARSRHSGGCAARDDRLGGRVRACATEVALHPAANIAMVRDAICDECVSRCTERLAQPAAGGGS